VWWGPTMSSNAQARRLFALLVSIRAGDSIEAV
jgi:hypothetical protein